MDVREKLSSEKRLIDADRAMEIVRNQGIAHPNAYHLTKYATLILREAPTVDAVPVRHGRWMHTKKHLWYKNKDGSIDEWRLDLGFHNGPMCQVCGEAVCMHCYPDWESMECEIGHYLCSVCGEVSTDAHENYCPNCGAKMYGGEDL